MCYGRVNAHLVSLEYLFYVEIMLGSVPNFLHPEDHSAFRNTKFRLKHNELLTWIIPRSRKACWMQKKKKQKDSPTTQMIVPQWMNHNFRFLLFPYELILTQIKFQVWGF